jgi:hypothetical protein
MVFEYPIARHKILIYLYIEEVKDKRGNLADVQNLNNMTYNFTASTLSRMKHKKYIEYEKTSSIGLTAAGFDLARYLYINPEKYNLVKCKEDLIERSLLEGYLIHPTDPGIYL